MKIESQYTYQPPRLGLFLLQILILLLFLILCSRFWYLQILQGQRYSELSEANQMHTEEIKAARGIIYDRNFSKLARNDITFSISVNREYAPDVDYTLHSIAAILDVDVKELSDNFNTAKRKLSYFAPVPVLEGLTYEQVAKVESKIMFMPGVSTQTKLRREYPYADSFAHILGYVAEATQEDMTKDEELALGDIVGRQGLEIEFEPTLRGAKGLYKDQRDVFGKIVQRDLEIEPIAGTNVVLSLDAELQNKIIGIMGDYAGSVVVMDPHTGHIEALVTLPSYDNNLFVRGLSHEKWNEISTDLRFPLQNRTIQSMYPPASVWKLVMSGLILKEGISEHASVYCGGSTRVGNREFQCWKKGGHGYVDMEAAIKHSCDIYFYEMGLRLGIDKISEFAFASGFGRPTGIDIPNEKGGLVPTKEWKLRRYSEKWQDGETVNVSIGQGQTLVTPVQIASYISSLLNGGKILKPQILLSEKANTSLETPTTEKHRQLLKKYMIETVDSGTARVLKSINPGITIGGKTGTAQVVKLRMVGDRRLKNEEMEYFERDHAWIAAFTEYKGKDYVIVTMLEHAGGGSSAAGPVVRDVIHEIYKEEIEQILAAKKK